MALSDQQLQALSRDAAARATAGDFAGAEPLFAEVAAARPNAGPALHLLGQVRLKLGRFADAREPLERAAKFLPREPAAHINLAGCLVQLGEHATALAALERAERLKPGDATIAYNKGRAFEALGRSGDAERAYDEALARDRHLVPALAARAELVAGRGDWAAALTDLDSALTARPDDARLRLRRAGLLLEQGDWPRGLAENEARFDVADETLWSVPLPRWNGEDRPAGGVLLYPEQRDAGGEAALRDTLMLMRAAATIAARGIGVGVQCAAGFDLLVGTDASGAFDRRRVAWRPETAGFGAAAPLRSLPHLLGWTLETLPPPTLIPAFAYRTGGDDAPPPRRGLRRVPRAHIDFDPTQANPPNPRLRIGWLCAERACLTPIAQKFAAWLERFDPAAALNSVDGSGLKSLAQHLYRCDLVVGDDRWPTHLAALLGVPVLMLLPRRADWLWGPRSGATRWYPTVELLREDEAGWTAATARLRALLDQANAVESWRDAPSERWQPGGPVIPA